MQHPSLSIVIPAYNEEHRLARSVRAIERYLTRTAPEHEIIIVDDGSKDRTLGLAHDLREEIPSIKVLGGAKNHGKGWATRQGVLASKGAYVLCTDADLSTPIEELERLMPRLSQGYDIAIGSRRAPGSEVLYQPLVRQAVSRGGNLLTRLVLRIPFTDTQCGFKLYRRSAALTLFEKLSLPRFSFDYEILARARRLGLSVAEVGVRWQHAEQSTVRAKDIVRALFDLFRIRFALFAEDGIVPPTQLLRFMAVGILNTLLDASVYFALTRFTDTFAGAIVAAKFLSFLCATISSLLLNRRWTFGVRSALTLQETVRFYLSVSAGLAVNVSSMYVLVHIFGVYDIAALFLSTIGTFLTNFTLSKLWVFKNAPNPSLARQS